MDYGVKYHIDINGGSASKELTKFLDTSNRVIPKVNKKFEDMNRKIKKTLENVNKLNRAISDLNKVKIDINSKQTLHDVDQIKRKIDSLKSKKVRISVDQKMTSGGRTIKSKKTLGAGRNAFGKTFSPTSMLSAGGIPFATTLGAGLIGIGLRNIITQASEFQHTMVSVRAILRTTDKDAATFNGRFEEMSMKMRKLGVDTKFTAVEIGEATRFLAMAGMDVSTITESMKSITNLAAIGDAGLGEMADIVTNIMTGYGIGSDQINQAADNMAAVTSRSNINILEMGESMKYASNYMRMAGIEFSEGAAAVGILGNAGIKGSRAGTSLRAMIIRLIKPTNKAQKVIDRLGLSFTHMVTEGGKTREVVKPLQQIFKDLKTSGATMEDLTTIFDKIGGGAAMALVDNVDQLVNLTESARKAGGVSDFLAEEKMKTVVGLSQQLTSKFLDLGQTMFDRLSPKIKMMMEQLLGWLKTAEADKLFDSIGDGISSVLDGLKKTAVFMKNNWGWLKYVFGGIALKGVARRGIGMAGSILGGAGQLIGGVTRVGRGVLGGAGTIGRIASIAGAGKLGVLSKIGGLAGVATKSVGALAASFGAFAVGGAIVGGLAAVGWQIYKAHENTKQFLQTKDEIADWSMSATGMNTEALDVLQDKLDKIRITGDEIEINKKKMGLGVSEQLWGTAVGQYKEMSGKKLWYSSESEKKIESGVLDAAKNMALGSAAAKEINEKFLSVFRAKDITEQNKLLGQLLGKGRHYAAIGQPSMALQRRMDMGMGLGRNAAEQARILKNSMEYNQALNDLALTRADQARSVLMSIQGGTRVEGMQALDALLGGDISLKSVWTTAQKRGLTKVEDMRALLRASGTSVQAIVSSLQSKGHLTQTIQALMAQAGFDKLMDTTIKSGTDIAKITTDDMDDLTGGEYSGTGKLGTRTGKMIIVNIDSLMNVENANFQNEEDLEAAKARIAEALMDVVKDFEISYN